MNHHPSHLPPPPPPPVAPVRPQYRARFTAEGLVLLGVLLGVALAGGGMVVPFLAVFSVAGASLLRRSRPFPGGSVRPARVVGHVPSHSSKGTPMNAEVLDYADEHHRWHRVTDQVSSSGTPAPVGTERTVSLPPPGVGEPVRVLGSHERSGLLFSLAGVVPSLLFVPSWGARLALLLGYGFYLRSVYRGTVPVPFSPGRGVVLVMIGLVVALGATALAATALEALSSSYYY